MINVVNADIRRKIVNLALAEVGVEGGKATGDDKYINFYNKLVGTKFDVSTTPWCAIFVTYIMRQAGVPTSVCPNYAGCTTFRDSFLIPNKLWKSRGTYTPKSGDIIMFDWKNTGKCDHTGIVEKVENGKVYTIEGNSTGSYKTYGVRHKSYSLSSKYIIGYGALKLDTIKNTTVTNTGKVETPVASTVPGYKILTAAESANAIWKFLIQQGFTKYAAAGVMGCWQQESGNRADRVEGDYLKSFPGFAKVLASNTALDSYTVDVLFPAYKKSNIGINKNAYKGKDGHYYPGIGLAQWTGPRGYNLFKWAEQQKCDWRDLNTQLAFFMSEVASRNLKVKLNAATSVKDATIAMLDGYEMYAGFSAKNPTQLNKRLDYANQMYKKFAGSTTIIVPSTPPTQTQKPNTPSTTTPTNTKATYIKKFQTWLNTNTNAGLAVDGSYGPKTKTAAIKAIQTFTNQTMGAGMIKLKVDGSFGILTKSAVPIIKRGSKGNLVYVAQGLLYALGYEPNGFDGSFGPGMEAAVKQFQSKKLLKPDGIIGKLTWNSLAK